MSSAESLTPELAGHILQRVGESGQPPEQGISHLNVGNHTYLDILDREYLQRLKHNPRGSSFKLVQGYYGGGKTHFLYCVRDLAWKHGFLTSVVNLSPKECPYDDPVKVYSSVASTLASPPGEEGAEPTRSVTNVLRDLADAKRPESVNAAKRPRDVLGQRGGFGGRGFGGGMMRAGVAVATAPAGTFIVTRALGPMVAPSPTVIRPRTIAPAPMLTELPMTGAFSSL